MSNYEIIQKTKLDYDSIKQTIEKRQKNNSKKQTNKEIDNLLITFNKNDYLELQNDVKKMKNDIDDIKNKIGELVEMMKALYEFEDV